MEYLLQLLKREKPLQIVGVMNAYVAIMAKEVGFKALYLSGANVANSCYGFPDIGVTTLTDVLNEVRKITAAVDLPLIVDIDTGWGSFAMIQRSIKEMIRAGAAGVHIEDQALDKRCGHLEGKKIVTKEEMVDRLKAAVDAKTDPNFVIMARTDGLAIEGLDRTLERALAYKEAGADMLFIEAAESLDQYKAFKKKVGLPILANLTEFGKTPLFTLEELRKADVDLALYPLSVNRLMNQAALKGLRVIREEGTQKTLLNQMQSREELYRFLKYS